MTALLSLLVVLSVSLTVMRVGTAALVLTGLSEEVARFQVQSAFLGVGYTTREAEQVMHHPVRRRIVMLLMLAGNAGVVAAVSGVVLLFAAVSGPVGWLPRAAGLVVGLVVLWLVFSSRWVDRHLTRVVDWALRRWTTLDVRDYISLLHLAGEYAVIELEVNAGDWLSDRTLAELDLRSEGVLVLGIERRTGGYVAVPRGHTHVVRDDTLIMYGRGAAIEELDRRPLGPDGDRAHAEAVERHHAALRLDVHSARGAHEPTAPR
jgi:TrkA-C domain